VRAALRTGDPVIQDLRGGGEGVECEGRGDTKRIAPGEEAWVSIDDDSNVSGLAGTLESDDDWSNLDFDRLMGES